METVYKAVALTIPVVCGFAFAYFLDIIIRLFYKQSDQHQKINANLFLNTTRMLAIVTAATLLISLFLVTIQALLF